LGYKVTKEWHGDYVDYIVEAPCGCYSCDNEVQQGHFSCSPSPDELIHAEQKGLVTRSYYSGRWYWFLTEKGLRKVKKVKKGEEE
jgi:hypothetical protein